MTPDQCFLSGFACGVLLSLHVRDTCLHSGSWLLLVLGLSNLKAIESTCTDAHAVSLVVYIMHHGARDYCDSATNFR